MKGGKESRKQDEERQRKQDEERQGKKARRGEEVKEVWKEEK